MQSIMCNNFIKGKKYMSKFLVMMKNGDSYLVSDITPYGSLDKYNEGVDCIEKKHDDEDAVSEDRIAIGNGLYAYMVEEYRLILKNKYYRLETNFDTATFEQAITKNNGGTMLHLLNIISNMGGYVGLFEYIGTWSNNKQNCINNYGGVFYGKKKYYAIDW